MTEFERQRIRRIIESTHGQPCLDSELDDIEQILSSPPDAAVDEVAINEAAKEFEIVEALIDSYPAFCPEQGHKFYAWGQVYQMITDYTASIRASLTDAEKEITRLKEFEWMYNDLNK